MPRWEEKYNALIWIDPYSTVIIILVLVSLAQRSECIFAIADWLNLPLCMVVALQQRVDRSLYIFGYFSLLYRDLLIFDDFGFISGFTLINIDIFWCSLYFPLNLNVAGHGCIFIPIIQLRAERSMDRHKLWHRGA
jgi:hypothetical protein